ncbi:GIY-YIG nuclease family protein [Blautia wexlerae]|uniref:GIY-YIG nuclease family protein n=1 Tax=Blautia wexlerae TaxID=418240 RepID=UPI001899CF0E
MNIINNYKVYIHTNLVNGKKYVGITQQAEKERWSNGNGYRENKKFYKDIQKYGWNDGFSHEIIKENISYKEARTLEKFYILKYDSVLKGYNNSNFNLGIAFQFDFDDIVPINNPYVENKHKEYFTRVPNSFIQVDIKKKYHLHRIFYLIYILIDKHRSYEDQSYIVISEIFNLCKYKQTKHKPKIFFEIIKCLLFLHESNMINITSDFDIHSVGYNECIQMDIIPENFDATDKFSKITSSQLDFIMMSESSINKENILMAFLYINSYIFIRPKNKNNEETISNPKSKPEAFFRSMESMAKELAISKDTLNQCIQCLTSSSENQKPLLIKREVGSIQPDPKKPPQNVPNIYVLNKEGYEQEIEWAILKMLEVYNVDSFGELTGKDVK